MQKPIIATALKGIFINPAAWEDAHKLWFEERAKELGDNSIKEWINKPDYFKGVDEVMKKIYPDLEEEQRTKKARELYFDATIKFIEQNPGYINQDTINLFQQLKEKYTIALITTNTQNALEKILTACKLNNLFDITEVSLPEEKDNIKLVFDRFLEKHNKPKIYLGTNQEALDYAKEKGIETVSEISELKEVLS